jgi:hypothetical protein
LLKIVRAESKVAVEFLIELRTGRRECVKFMTIPPCDNLLGGWMKEKETIRLTARSHYNALQCVRRPLVFDRSMSSTILDICNAEHGKQKAVVHLFVV